MVRAEGVPATAGGANGVAPGLCPVIIDNGGGRSWWKEAAEDAGPGGTASPEPPVGTGRGRWERGGGGVTRPAFGRTRVVLVVITSAGRPVHDPRARCKIDDKLYLSRDGPDPAGDRGGVAETTTGRRFATGGKASARDRSPRRRVKPSPLREVAATEEYSGSRIADGSNG